MAKEGEINYLKSIGSVGIEHAINKPFSDKDCGIYLMEIGTIMSLLQAPPAKLLDLGCGTGWTSCFFAKAGYEVVGQDISDDMIHYANLNKNRAELDNLNFLVCDYEDMKFDNEFDCAVFFDSLHHSIDEEAAIQMVYKALKPGGVCITLEPGVGHAENQHSINAVSKFNVTEKDMPPTRILEVGKSAGFRKFKVYPYARSINSAIYGESTRSSPLNKLVKSFASPFFSMFRALLLVSIIEAKKQRGGIVVMKK